MKDVLPVRNVMLVRRFLIPSFGYLSDFVRLCKITCKNFQMKAAIHDNLNIFVGLVFNQGDEILILWKFCSRGTVQAGYFVIYLRTIPYYI